MLHPATGPVQERRLDLRLHPRPNRRRSSSQVANSRGRTYSGVLGAARSESITGADVRRIVARVLVVVERRLVSEAIMGRNSFARRW